MITFEVLEKQLKTKIYEMHECVANKKGINDTLLYGNYNYIMGQIFMINELMGILDLQKWVKVYEQNSAQYDEWTKWADKLYRKLKGEV